jgi:hypothetical protein
MEVFIMSRQRVWLLGLGLMLAVTAATVLCQADEPKKGDGDKLSPEKMTKAMDDIAMAYQLADIGKRAGSPEALLAAAKMFSRLSQEEIVLIKLEGVKPVTGKADDKNKPKPTEEVKEEGGEKVTFAAEIKKLKEEANKLNSPKNDKLAELIAAVPEKGRGSLGGPAWMGPYTVAPGNTNSLRFNFRGREWAQVMVSVSNGAPVRLEIYNTDGALIGQRQGRGTLEIGWTPGFTRAFDVYVTGVGGRPATYDVYKN